MQPVIGHHWVIEPGEAVALQQDLAKRVIIAEEPGEFRYIAGLDCAYTRDGSECLAAVLLYDRFEHKLLEQCYARGPVTMDYIPGLLSFRESATLIAALQKLERKPDALMCDGHGVAHSRRFGVACHLGVLLDIPAVGCAKQRFVGIDVKPEETRGSRLDLVDKGEMVGTVLRTQQGVKCVYVSPGHRMSHQQAADLVLDCARQYRLPEPTRLADILVGVYKREVDTGGNSEPRNVPL